MIIIGFGHRKRVGKDQAAKFVSQWVRLNHESVSLIRRGFARKVYDTCYLLYGWAGFQPWEYYEEHPEDKDAILPKLLLSPRQLLIEVGNKMRKVYSRTWIDLLLSVKCDILLIPDVRYYNEFTAIKALNGFVYKVERPEIEDTSDIADDALETFNEWDDVLVNDASLKDFNDRVIEQVCKRHF